MMLRILFVCLFLFSPSGAFSFDESEVQGFVQDVSDKTFSVLQDSTLADEVKEEKLSTLFRSVVDTEWMGRFVLGRYYRTATPEQKEKYQHLYREFLIGSYIPKFREYTGEKFEVIGVRKDTDDMYIVHTKLEMKGDKPHVKVDYRLVKNGKGFKIVDIVGEGISLITTQRSDFSGLISQKGLDYFIDRLESKVNSQAQ